MWRALTRARKGPMTELTVPKYLSKAKHNTHMEALVERMYSSYSFTTSTLDGGEWSASRPGRALHPGKGPRYPLYRRLEESRAGLDTEDRAQSLLGCTAVLLNGCRPTFQRCVLPPSSGRWVSWALYLNRENLKSHTEVRGKILSPLPRIEPGSPGRPVCSQTQYWLSYPGPYNI
jgi:hypothetical protein